MTPTKMQLEACFASVLILLSLTEIYGGAIVQSPRDTFVMIGQRVVLNCTVECTHKIQWTVNVEAYRHLPAITTDTTELDKINVEEVEDDSSADDSSMCKQSFEIKLATPEWHEKSVQCIAVPKDGPSETDVHYSKFATVYIDGIVDPEMPCPSSTMSPSSQGGMPTSTMVPETTSTATSPVCMCATPSTSPSDSAETVSAASSAQPLSHISHLIFILISCYILL